MQATSQIKKPATTLGEGPASIPYAGLLWYGALLVCAFGFVLDALAKNWMSDENMGHGFFVPVIAGYVAWEQRASWLSAPREPNSWGIAVVVWGALQLWLGTLGSELFLQRTAFIVTLAGLVLFFLGWRGMKALAFPFALLFFMVPIPGIAYKQITFPLQLLASSFAESVLGLFGYLVIREGNILELAGQQLSVAEACSGLRSLNSLSFFSLVYAYFFDQRTWVRWLLLVCAAPVAVIANAGRIVLTGMLGEVNPELATGVYHTFSGWSLFVIAIGLLVLIHKALSFRAAPAGGPIDGHAAV
jgi:exosortase